MRSCPGLCLAQLTISFAPLIGVTSMSFRPGCHRPFCRSYRLRSLLLLSWVSLLFIVWFLSFLLLPPSTSCFSMSSLQPSSLSDPSPCIYPAGAYCFLRKVRDSNPRAIADLLLSRELPYHSANLPCSVCRNVIAALSLPSP